MSKSEGYPAPEFLLELQIRGRRGWGRVQVPMLEDADDAQLVAKQLRAIARLVVAQGRAIAVLEEDKEVVLDSTQCDRMGCHSSREYGLRFCSDCDKAWVKHEGGVDYFRR